MSYQFLKFSPLWAPRSQEHLSIAGSEQSPGWELCGISSALLVPPLCPFPSKWHWWHPGWQHVASWGCSDSVGSGFGYTLPEFSKLSQPVLLETLSTKKALQITQAVAVNSKKILNKLQESLSPSKHNVNLHCWPKQSTYILPWLPKSILMCAGRHYLLQVG